MKRTWVLIFALVALGVGLVAIRGGHAGDGPLDGTQGGGHGSAVPVDAPYDSFSVLLSNLGDEAIQIERIRLVEVAGPVRLLGVRARLVPDEGHAGGGGLVGTPMLTESFPLSERDVLPKPASYGESGSPDQALQILFRIKMTEAGIGYSGGVEVKYRSGGKRFNEEYPFYMLLCAPRERYVGPEAQDCSEAAIPSGDGVLG